MIDIIFKDNDRKQSYDLPKKDKNKESLTIQYSGNYALLTKTADSKTLVTVIPLEYIKQIEL